MSFDVINRGNIISIDEKIGFIQRILSEKLTWNGTNNIYGLIEKKQKNKSNTPQIYIQNGEYINPFFNDTISSTIAFYETNRTFNKIPESTIELICTQNIKEVYLNDDRNISKSVNDIQVILRKYKLAYDFGKFTIGLDVFNNFDKKYISNMDMHTWAVFSLEFKIFYKKQ